MHEREMFYQITGNGERWLVFLHGWGLDSSCFAPYVNQLKNDYKILLVDFPPFGKSKEPTNAWTMQDYEQTLLTVFDKNHVKNPIVIAHSFGGRVAIILAGKYNQFAKMILLSAAGLKPKFRIDVFVKRKISSFCKTLNLKSPKWIQSEDYQVLSPVMKKTFSNIVSTHLDDLAKQITCPTFLIWGKKDKSTPIEMANRMHAYIKNSKLYLLNDGDHFAFATHASRIIDAIEHFCDE